MNMSHVTCMYVLQNVCRADRASRERDRTGRSRVAVSPRGVLRVLGFSLKFATPRFPQKYNYVRCRNVEMSICESRESGCQI